MLRVDRHVQHDVAPRLAMRSRAVFRAVFGTVRRSGSPQQRSQTRQWVRHVALTIYCVLKAYPTARKSRVKAAFVDIKTTSRRTLLGQLPRVTPAGNSIESR
jgi:hypothetical protein